MLRTTIIAVFFLFAFESSYSQNYTEIEWFNPPVYAKFESGNHKGVTHIYKIKENSETEFSLERYNDRYSFKNPSPNSNDPEKYMWTIQVLDEDGIYRWVQGRLVLVENTGEPTYKYEIARRTVEQYTSRGRNRTRIYEYREREYLNVTPMPGIFTQMFSELSEAYSKGDFGTIIVVIIVLFYILYKITSFFIKKSKNKKKQSHRLIK